VFGNPWDSETDMFACYAAVRLIVPFLLWCGGELTSAIFGFGARWSLGVFMVAALVGAAGFMTIVGGERTSFTIDCWRSPRGFSASLIIAPRLGLAAPTSAAIICYAVLPLFIPVYVLRLGRFETVSTYGELADHLEPARPVLRVPRLQAGALLGLASEPHTAEQAR
jgi:hypothetical protein